MNPDQIEAVRQAIRLPSSALNVAIRLKIPTEQVYQALVSLEARGDARIRVHHGKRPWRFIQREWVQA